MPLIHPNHKTCVNTKRGYCIFVHYGEKTLPVFENAPWFGGNMSRKSMLKTIILENKASSYVCCFVMIPGRISSRALLYVLRTIVG